MKRVAVIVFPGSNCDADTLDAARAAGSDAYYVWHRERDLRQADVAILPGGFSYGDYLRAGAIARSSRAPGKRRGRSGSSMGTPSTWLAWIQRNSPAGGAIINQVWREFGLVTGAGSSSRTCSPRDRRT